MPQVKSEVRTGKQKQSKFFVDRISKQKTRQSVLELEDIYLNFPFNSMVWDELILQITNRKINSIKRIVTLHNAANSLPIVRKNVIFRSTVSKYIDWS